MRRAFVAIAVCGLCALAVTRTAQAAATLSSDIAPQPLAQALASYARQTGLQVVYLSESVRARDSNGAKTGLASAAALAQLLEGTGLRFEFLNARTVRIFSGAAAARLTGPRADNSAAVLSEIIITGMRSAEQTSHTPASIAVWTAEDMEASGIKGMTEIGALTPGVEFDFPANVGDIATNLIIRGVMVPFGVATGVYIDEIPVPAARDTTFARSFPSTFDLDRVEVLRGPQGTLLGQGTLGGAVRFSFNQPSLTTYSGVARTEWATSARGDMSYEAGAALGGPVIQEVLGLRVSGWYRSDGGYVDRIDHITGSLVDHNVNRLLSKSARVALTWAPSDSVRVTPSLTSESYSQRDLSIFYVNLSDPRIGQLRNDSLTRQPGSDAFYLANLKLTAGFRFADLSAVTSYFDRSAAAGFDVVPDYPIPYATAATFNIDIAQRMYSQDVRLTSANPQAALNWVAGAFYSNTHTRETSEIDHTQGLPENPRVTDMHGTQVEAFAQGSFSLGRRLTATAGLRLGRASFDGVSVGPPLIRLGARETSVTPKFDLSYQADVNYLVYLAVAKGYRSGSIEPAVAVGCDSPDLLPSNSVWSYEIGAKNELLGGRAHLEASIFRIQWNNNQSGVNSSSNCGIDSPRGTAASDGFELTAQALVTKRLRTAVALAYTDAHYTQTVIEGGAVIVRSGDAVGGLPQVASPWNVTSSIDYQFPLSSDVTVELRAEDIFHSRNPGPFTSDNPASSDYLPGAKPNPATNLLNLRATARWPHFELALFVNNALDSQPTLILTPISPGSGRLYAATFRPRTIGLTANWQY